MSTTTAKVLKRAAFALGAVVVAFLIAFLSGPDVVNIVGTGNEWIVAGVVLPLLAALEKFLTEKKAAKKPPVVGPTDPPGPVA